LGRTGIGKTALIQQVLKNADHAIELSPENLALNYITNSNILKFFEEAGVALDVFYQLLWRHILAVELLKMKFNIRSETQQQDFISNISSYFVRDRAKYKAFNYLIDWGKKFWETTEYRTKEFAERLEADLKASVGIDSTFINAGVEGAKKLTTEQRVEVKQRGTQIVNSVQIKDLHEVIEFLAEKIFNGSFDRYYIVIDRLDESWVDDRIRFKLIRALLEAIKSFKKIRNAKVIVALRTDLHYRTLREIRNPSFQEEKFRSLYLSIKWSRDQLIKLLDARVNFLYRRQYTRQDVALRDIISAGEIDQRSPIDYMLERTFFRPREAIIFINECLAKAEGQPAITLTNIREVEVNYSRNRLHALADEWRREYPRIEDAAKILSGRTTPFLLETVTSEEAIAFAERLLSAKDSNPDDPIQQLSEEFITVNRKDYTRYIRQIFSVLYQVGLIGVKSDANLARQWSFEDSPIIDEENLKPTSQIEVHKTFWAALGVTSRGRQRQKSG
jgi:hypothetical protein